MVVVTNISYGDGSHILIHIETEIDPRLPPDLTLRDAVKNVLADFAR